MVDYSHSIQPSLAQGFLSIVKRDLRVAFRQPGEMLNPVIFYFIVITMLPLGVSPESKVLATLAPGMLWVVALLASLLSLESLFKNDYEDGSLEQMIISPLPLYFLSLAKCLVHWLVTGLPLTLTAPLLGVLLSLPIEGYWPLVASLLLGTLTLSLIGGIGAALTVSVRRGGLLLSLIIMPFYVPVLIYGSSAVRMAVEGFGITSIMAILGAFCALALTLGPIAISGALKMSIEE